MLLGLAAAGCADPGAAPSSSRRAARYGIFEDLVLYRGRAAHEGGPFFLDRFETTRQDWWEFARRGGADGGPWGAGPPPAGTEYLPVARVSLHEARRFARWRFCRLPRRDEWEYAATGRGGYVYPWGNLFRPPWVNSAELGLGSPTPVGTFESGRDDEGAYDLLGNVAEWTESVDPSRFSAVERGGIWLPPLPVSRLVEFGRLAAVRPWGIDGLPWPTSFWVAACGADLPRLVVGGHYRARLKRDTETASLLDGVGPLWERGASELGDTVGIRLASDPADLVRALLEEPAQPSAAEEQQLRRFLRRPSCRDALAEALGALVAAGVRGGPLSRLLADELAP